MALHLPNELFHGYINSFQSFAAEIHSDQPLAVSQNRHYDIFEI